MVAFSLGFASAILARKRKNLAFIMFVTCFPVVENAIVVKYSFDNYQLATSWFILAAAVVPSILGAIFVGNSEERFS